MDAYKMILEVDVFILDSTKNHFAADYSWW